MREVEAPVKRINDPMNSLQLLRLKVFSLLRQDRMRRFQSQPCINGEMQSAVGGKFDISALGQLNPPGDIWNGLNCLMRRVKSYLQQSLTGLAPGLVPDHELDLTTSLERRTSSRSRSSRFLSPRPTRAR